MAKCTKITHRHILIIMDDDPNTKSYEDFLPPNADISGQEERYKEIFRKRRTYIAANAT